MQSIGIQDLPELGYTPSRMGVLSTDRIFSDATFSSTLCPFVSFLPGLERTLPNVLQVLVNSE